MTTVGFVGSMSYLFTRSGVPVLRGQDVLPNRLDPTDTKFISPETHNVWKKSALKGGDVVMVRVGAGAGTACVIPPNLGEANAASIVVIRPTVPKLDANFLSTVINSDFGTRQVNSLLVGGAQPVINTATVAAFRIPLPPLPEQRAIATALSDVDGLLGGLDRLIAKKRDLKQAAMQQLLTGHTRLPGFHGEWEVKRLGDLFNCSGGYSASRDQLSTEGHCYLHYGDIHGSTKTCIDTDTDFHNIPKLDIPLKRVSSASLLDDGDVVFVDASEDDAGTSKHVVVVNKGKKPFISGLHTIVAKSKTDELAHEYRRYCFQTPAIRQQFLFYSVGTKVSGISKRNIPKLTLSFPTVPEQTAIAEVLTEMDGELAALEQRREKTRALKQAMMQELLTGRTRLV
jgi:type I restriction enzyme S subunit